MYPRAHSKHYIYLPSKGSKVFNLDWSFCKYYSMNRKYKLLYIYDERNLRHIYFFWLVIISNQYFLIILEFTFQTFSSKKWEMREKSNHEINNFFWYRKDNKINSITCNNCNCVVWILIVDCLFVIRLWFEKK